jgi:hypothetical protein
MKIFSLRSPFNAPRCCCYSLASVAFARLARDEQHLSQFEIYNKVAMDGSKDHVLVLAVGQHRLKFPTITLLVG